MIRFFLLMLTSGAVQAAQVHFDYYYYKVSGDTVMQLADSIDTNTPIHQAGEKWIGQIRARTLWDWKLQTQADGSCYLASVDAMADIQFVMPLLDSSSLEVKEVWDRWYPQLWQHEMQHARDAIAVVEQGETELLNLSPRGSCEAVEEMATELKSQLLERVTEAGRRYDEQTKHGEKTGAGLADYMK
jgi:predicted secreted Zn-dependent protease